MILVNPKKITNFNRTLKEKEAFLLFGICVAGKEALQIALKVFDFLYGNQLTHQNINLFEELKEKNILLNNSFEYINDNFIINYDKTPFEIIKEYNEKNIVIEELQRVKMGKYSLINKAIKNIIELNIDLNEVPKPELLEQIAGLSFKTSRFFIIHTYENSKYAALDTHVLKFLKLNNINLSSNSTPGNKTTYKYLENEFINIYNHFIFNVNNNIEDKNVLMLKDYIDFDKAISIANFDLAIWLFMKESKTKI